MSSLPVLDDSGKEARYSEGRHSLSLFSSSQSHVFQYVPQTHQARSSFRAKFALSDPSGWNDFI